MAGAGRGLGRGRAPPRRQAGVWPWVPSAGGCTLTCGAAGAAGLPGSEGLSSPHGGETQSARPAGHLAAPCWCWVKETSRADNTGHKTVPSALCPAAPDSASARAARWVPAPALPRPRPRADGPPMPHAPPPTPSAVAPADTPLSSCSASELKQQQGGRSQRQTPPALPGDCQHRRQQGHGVRIRPVSRVTA